MPAIPPSEDQPNADAPIRLGRYASAAQLLPAIALPGFFRAMFSDDAGNPSSMRAAMLGADALVLTAWAWISMRSGALQPLPQSVVTLLFAFHGFKFAQKFKEPSPSISTATDMLAATAGSAAFTPPPPGQPLPGLAGAPGGGSAVPLAQPAAPTSPEAAAMP